MSNLAGVPLARSGPLAAWALVVIAVAVVVVPLLASRDPLAIRDVLARRLVPPFHRDAMGDWHLLGTDRFGRDIFVRMMLAGRISLLVGVVGSLLAGAAGTLAGLVAGWRRGAVDRLLMGAADVLLALPRLVLLLVVAALWSPGATTVALTTQSGTPSSRRCSCSANASSPGS